MTQAQVAEFCFGGSGRHRPHADCKSSPLLHEVQADYGAACRSKYLDGKLAQQSQADHRHNFAQLDLSRSNSMQCDGADRGEGSTLETYVSRRKPGQEHSRDTGKLSMDRVTRARTSHAISHANVYDAFAHFNHGSSRTVPES